MMPLGDDNRDIKRPPIVTYALIILNIIFFMFELVGQEAFVMRWSFIPSNFLSDPIGNMPTLFTAMFMHAGWGHLIGNMLYLWIFGDNLEDKLGRGVYILFYLLSGIIASFMQLVMDPASSIPNLGASGAIAGVLGGYIYLRPQSQVSVLVGRSVVQMSALIVIGFWFLIQFISQIGSLASAPGEGEGGVAYMAHIGGFVAGLAMSFLLNKTGKVSP
jgi:membrane associated rhomboid family serine protease